MTDLDEKRGAEGLDATAEGVDTKEDVDTAPEPLNPALAQLLATAKRDSHEASLEHRVFETVAYRSRLVEETASTPLLGRLAWDSRLVWGVSAFAVAASVLFWMRGNTTDDTTAHVDHEPVELRAEPVEGANSPGTQVAPGTRALPPTDPSVAQPPKPAPRNPCIQARVAEGSSPLIDDFEDGDDAVPNTEGRSGLWRWVRDTDAPGTAPALLPVPRVPETGTSKLAVHVKGERLREWGATVEFVFGQHCYDASAYAGIAFEAKGSTRLYVAPREVSVMPVAAGGLCEEDCHNNHVAQIQLEEEWTTHEVRFDEVEQRGYDRPALDPKRIHSLAFLIRPEDTPYDVWLDNVRFLKR